MGVIDFAEAYKNLIAGNQTLVEGTAVKKIIADNGDEIGDAVFQVVQGGNGSGSTVWTMVKTVGTSIITTGLSFLSMSLPTAFAAIAPTLGIVAGTSIYEIVSGDSEFSNRLLNALAAEGKTIGGKVICYFNGENLYFDDETINIIKNSLLNNNVYSTITPSHETTGTVRVETYSDGRTLFSFLSSYQPFVYAANVLSDIYDWFDEYKDYIAFGNVTLSNDTFQGASPITIYLYPYSEVVTIGQTNSGTVSISTYGTRSGPNEPFYITNAYLSPATNIGLDIGSYDRGDKHYLSGLGLISNPYLQKDAKYPNNQDIPYIYPDWIPWDYPIPDPDNLPTVYPVKYPGTNPDPLPDQDPAQNPAPENVPDTYPYVIPDLPLPDPIPYPYPDSNPDPDPQPDPDPLPDDTNPNPQPDPTDPNPDPAPSPIIPIAPLPDTVDSSKLFTVYNPSQSELDSLGGYLWDSSIIAAIRDIWQNPLDGIISLIQVYVTPLTSGNHNIILGFLDSGISADIVSTQFVTLDCGSITVPENKKNATDYAPYTSLHLYLPFIGIVELDTNECMNSSINVVYKIDVYTGTCLATVKITRSVDMPNAPILYTYSGNCSQQLPLTSGNATGMLSTLIGGITAGLSVASGGGIGVVAGAQMAGNSLTHEMFHVSHSGNLSANAGIMGQKKPYLIIGRRHCYDANGYDRIYGYPANKTIVLSNHTGFTRVKECLLKTTALNPERNEILRLLKEGVIV